MSVHLRRRRRAPLVAAFAAAACATIAGTAGMLASQNAPGARSILRFGLSVTILTEVNPNDARAATQVWARGAGVSAGAWDDAEATVVQDSASLVKAVNSNALDIVAMSSVEYLSVERSMRAEPFLTYEQGGRIEASYVLLARDDVRSIRDLENKRVAICSPSTYRDIGDTWLDVMLIQAGLPEKERAFQQLRVFRKRSQAVLALYFRQVDAAVELQSAYATAVELNPQLGRELRIVAQSPPLLRGLVCVRAGLNAEHRRRYLERAAELYRVPDFKQTFLMLRISRLVPWDPRFLDNTRALVASYDAFHRVRARQEPGGSDPVRP